MEVARSTASALLSTAAMPLASRVDVHCCRATSYGRFACKWPSLH